jgi:hypothetical protein
MGINVHLYVLPDGVEVWEFLQSTDILWMVHMRDLYHRMDVFRYWTEDGFLFDPWGNTEKYNLDWAVCAAEIEMMNLSNTLETRPGSGPIPHSYDIACLEYNHCDAWLKMFRDLRLLRTMGINCRIIGK